MCIKYTLYFYDFFGSQCVTNRNCGQDLLLFKELFQEAFSKINFVSSKKNRWEDVLRWMLFIFRVWKWNVSKVRWVSILFESDVKNCFSVPWLRFPLVSKGDFLHIPSVKFNVSERLLIPGSWLFLTRETMKKKSRREEGQQGKKSSPKSIPHFFFLFLLKLENQSVTN